MKKPTVIITGCGYKPIKHEYIHRGEVSHDSIYVDGAECKMNIGTAAAYYFAKKGVSVLMVSRTQGSLEKIRTGLVALGCDKQLVGYVAADLMTDDGIDKLIQALSKDETYYWVQSVGLGAGAYKIPNDNIYLPFEKIAPDVIRAELEVLIATHRMMLKLAPVFRRQIRRGQHAKISLITSMSGERGYHFGATHVAAKHALVGYIKGIERELHDEGIEIVDIRPGGIDTGMYDNPHVRKAVEEISRRTKMWGGRKPIFARPLNVAKKIYDSMFSSKPRRVYRIRAKYQR